MQAVTTRTLAKQPPTEAKQAQHLRQRQHRAMCIQRAPHPALPAQPPPEEGEPAGQDSMGTTCKFTEWVPHLEGWDPATLAALCSSGRLHHRCVLLTMISTMQLLLLTQMVLLCDHANKQEGHTSTIESQQAVGGTGCEAQQPRSSAGDQLLGAGTPRVGRIHHSQHNMSPHYALGLHTISSRHSRHHATLPAQFVAADRQRTQSDTQTVLQGALRKAEHTGCTCHTHAQHGSGLSVSSPSQ
jgi:hypothetical protein